MEHLLLTGKRTDIIQGNLFIILYKKKRSIINPKQILRCVKHIKATQSNFSRMETFVKKKLMFVK